MPLVNLLRLVITGMLRSGLILAANYLPMKNLAGTGRSIGIFLDNQLISAPVGPEFASSGIAGGCRDYWSLYGTRGK